MSTIPLRLMHRHAARVTCMAVCAMLVFGVWLQGPSTSAADRPAADAVSGELPTSVSDLIDCIARNQHLAAVVLVDESSSLKKTDKEARRVAFSRSLTDALRQISSVQIDGVDSTLDLLVLGFSTDVRNGRLDPPGDEDWVTVDGAATYAEVESAIETFRERDDGLDTDYVTALQTAQELVVRRAQTVPAGASICTAILWFTDGKFDISRNAIRRPWAQDIELTDAGRKQAVERGVELLCAEGGIADRLRSAETFLLTFALLSDSFVGDDEVLLRRATLGDAGCGGVDASRLGAYFPGTTPDDLVDCFYLALQGRGCNPPPPSAPCSFEEGCPVSFIVDDSTVAVSVEIFAVPNTDTVTIRPPGGEAIPIAQLTPNAVPGTTLTAAASNRAGFVTLAINASQPGVAGRWTVDHRPPDGGALDVKITVTPNYRLEMTVPESVVRGEPVMVDAVIVGGNRRPIDPASLSSEATVQVEVTDGEDVEVYDAEQIGDSAAYRVTFTSSTSGTATSIGVRASGEFTGADGSPRTLLTPETRVEAIFPGFLDVTSALSIGGIEAARAQHRLPDGTLSVLPVDVPAGSITFRAPRDIGGSACIQSVEFLSAASTQSLVPNRDCVELGAGAEESIEFRFQDSAPVTGAISGRVRIELVSALDGTTREIDVPVDGSLVVRPPDPYSDQERAWWLLVAGLFIPLVVYLVLARLGSRFKDPTLISIRTSDARVTPDGLWVSPPKQGAGLEGFDYLAARGSNSRTVHGGSLKFEAPGRALRLPIAEVTSNISGSVVVSERNVDGPFIERAPLDHQLQGQWVFVGRSVDRDAVVGTLSVLVQEPEGVRAEIQRLEQAARMALVPRCSQLASHLTTSPPSSVMSAGGRGPDIGPGRPNDSSW